MVLLFSLRRAVAAAAPARRARPRDHPGGRHRRQHHPGSDARLVHAPQPRPGLLRGDAGAVQRPGRRGRPRDRHVGRGDLLGRGDDDAPELDPRGALGRERRRLRGRRPGPRIPNSGSTDMGNVSWVCPTIHPELSIARRGHAGPLDPVPRRRRDAPRRRDDAPGLDARRPGRVRAVRRPGARRGGLAGVRDVQRGLRRGRGRQRDRQAAEPAVRAERV